MKIGEEVWAIVDEDGTVLGDGECASLSSMKPDDDDIALVQRYCDWAKARVVRCNLVLTEEQIQKAQKLKLPANHASEVFKAFKEGIDEVIKRVLTPSGTRNE